MLHPKKMDESPDPSMAEPRGNGGASRLRVFGEDGGKNKGKSLEEFKTGYLGEIISLQKLPGPVTPKEEHCRTRLCSA